MTLNEMELDFRKFEYNLVNDKININLNRLNMLCATLIGSIFGSITCIFKLKELHILFILLPIFILIWLFIFMYLQFQVKRQKICLMNHAKEINKALGKVILTYDTKIIPNLWKELPSFIIILLLPPFVMLIFCCYFGFSYLCNNKSIFYALVFLFMNISLSIALLIFIYQNIWPKSANDIET